MLAIATLVAPIDGRVTALNIAVGDDASGTAIELQSSQLALSVSVTEDDILSLKVGQQATIVITATDGTANGTLTSMDPVASSSNSCVVSYTVVVTLDDAEGTNATASGTPTGSGADSSGDAATSAAASSPAAPTTADVLAGMSADLTIVIAQANDAIAVPAIALSGTSGSYTVRVLAADGTVETRPVDVGLVTSDLAQITSGITAGETVVTGIATDRTSTASSSGSNSGGFPGGAGGFPGGAGGFPGGAGGFQAPGGD